MKTKMICLVFLLWGAVSVMAAPQRKTLSDSTIKSIAEYRLYEKGFQDDIKVALDDGVVTLSGTVRSVADKRRAADAVRNAPGVSGVENKLTVETGRASADEVAKDIGKAIRSNPYFDIFDWVDGEVSNGVVTLKGYVREPWRKKEYERLAEAVAGVSQVNNQIEVLPTSGYDDQIRIAAARAIYGDPRFVRYANRSLPPIHIVVNNGRVTLKGAVANQLEKQLAESLVRTEVLSFDVANELTVDSDFEKKPS
jgi:osmotically-inducible protein OsmY